MHYEKNSVGAIMEFGVITVRPDVTLGTVQRYLRRLGKMPDNTDKLFVTSRINPAGRAGAENHPAQQHPAAGERGDGKRADGLLRKTMRKKRRVPSNVTTW
jgi:hypothetical protein